MQSFKNYSTSFKLERKPQLPKVQLKKRQSSKMSEEGKSRTKNSRKNVDKNKVDVMISYESQMNYQSQKTQKYPLQKAQISIKIDKAIKSESPLQK